MRKGKKREQGLRNLGGRRGEKGKYEIEEVSRVRKQRIERRNDDTIGQEDRSEKFMAI